MPLTIAEPGLPPDKPKSVPEKLAEANEQLRQAARQEEAELIGIVLSKLKRLESTQETLVASVGELIQAMARWNVLMEERLSALESRQGS